MWYEPLLGALAYCIKVGFTVFVLVYGLKELTTFVFTFLTEELENKPE